MFLLPCLISKESDAFRSSCFHCPMYKPVLSSHPRKAQKVAASGKWLLSGGEYQYRNMVREHSVWLLKTGWLPNRGNAGLTVRSACILILIQ